MIESARQCLTGIDNQTIDPGRVGGAAATAVFLALSIADMALKAPTEPKP